MKHVFYFIRLSALLLLCALPVRLHAEVFDLVALSLEELMDVEISLVSRKNEPLFTAPAATFVLTGKDLRRSGVTSIPEALRLVPGLSVARLDANKWAISARGFNGRFANKLLVQIDGRSVYTPLFSGVFWETQDVFLEDVERIEIIRGPGATLWGANAVSGIINIVTKHSGETQGLLVQGGAGSFERAFTQVRHGGQLSEQMHYRLYGRTFSRGAFDDSSGRASNDDWQGLHGGGRLDWSPTPADALTLQGEFYTSEIGQAYIVANLESPYSRRLDDRTDYRAHHALGRWQHLLSDTSDLSLQLYYDRTHWSDMFFVEKRNTYNIDFQHRFARRHHELVWGLGYHHISDQSETTPSFALIPARRTVITYSGFAQYEIASRDENLRFILGSKFEHNDYTGLEIQPSTRAIWTPTKQHAIWAAVARAVRTPSRAESDVFLKQQALPPDAISSNSPVSVLTFVGNPEFDTEELLAYELGYRRRPSDALSIDVALFFNDYDQLRGGIGRLPELGTAPGPPHLILPFAAANNLAATTYGLEMTADWHDPHGRWRMRAVYSYLDINIELGKSLVPEAKSVESETPKHQLSLWHSHHVRRSTSIDAMARYVSNLSFSSLTPHEIDAYLELDLRLAWTASDNLELALVGRNLLGGHPAEFKALFVENLFTQTPRSAYLMLTYRPNNSAHFSKRRF